MISRFVTPDTVIPQTFNPQALNRYSYGLNNPSKYIDPSGHIPVLVLKIGVIFLNALVGAVGPPNWTPIIAPSDLLTISDIADTPSRLASLRTNGLESCR